MANKHGGGSATNKNGLKFEQDTDLKSLLEDAGFSIHKGKISYKGNHIGILAPKHKLYKRILEHLDVDWTKRISKQLLPDEAILIESDKKIYIIEKKFQSGSGSVDEKLQTCDFKLKQYKKLFEGTKYQVSYIYVLNDWFKQPQYEDVRKYINDVGCEYFFNEIPFAALNLNHS